MKKYAAILVAVGFLSACVAPNSMLVNPSTGEARNCAASGWGWAGAPLAYASYNSCIKSLKSIGYVPVEDIQPSTLTVTSDPPDAQLLVGPDKASLDVIGTTPFKAVQPNHSRMWAAECYQVRKKNYLDSQVECRNQKWGDRVVTFTLKPDE